MASLNGQTIASSYEQLLHVDRDGGGNSTTLVDVKDGDNGTTFALKLATDKIQVNGSSDLDGAVTINESSADADFRVESNGNANMIFVDGGNDRVGIGTNSVSSDSAFGVSGSMELIGAGNKYFIPRQSDGALTGSIFSRTGNNITISGAGSSSGQIEFIPSSANSSAVAMTIDSSQNVKINTGALQLNDVAQSIDFIQSGAINFDSNNDQTGRVLTIGCNRANGATGGTTIATFTEDGKVGIGTTSPAYPLDIVSTINNGAALAIRGDVDADGRFSGIQFGDNGTTSYSKGGIFYEGKDAYARGNLHFALEGGTGTDNADLSDARMTITYGGNVGINSTSPATRLEINDTNDIPLRFGDVASTPSATAGYIGMSTSAYNGNNGDLVLIPRTSAASNICLMGVKTGLNEGQPSQTLHIKGASNTGGIRLANTGFSYYNEIRNNGDGLLLDIDKGDAGGAGADLRINISDSEKMRITNGGKVGIGNTSPAHTLTVEDNVNEYTASFKNNRNPSSSAPYVMRFRFHETPDNGTSEFLRCDDSVGSSAVARLVISSEGDVTNHDNSYGSISDKRIKQDIKDANSQWNDIKAVRVRNFKKNDDVAQYGDKAWQQIGVIAQELEESGMDKLVKEHPATDNEINVNDDINEGDMVKTVSYSVLYMKSIKALQEAMTRIETLEAKVESLENA